MAPSYDLTAIARKVMLERGLQPDYPKNALDQLAKINAPAPASPQAVDLRKLLWCSIDNDDSKDLDQLNYAQQEKDNQISLWVAVADVDSLVKKNTPIDSYAQINTVTVYTPTKNFSMLPEKLSTNLTSLNENQDRMAIVIKMMMNPEGEILSSEVFSAVVHNYAQLAYNALGAWFEGRGPIPPKVAAVPGLDKCLTLQNDAAKILRKRRFELGALSLETPEATSIFQGGHLVGLKPAVINDAHHLIEQFMIGANTAIAKFLSDAKIPSLRRVVRVPKRWDRIVELAKDKGETLPETPDSKALDQFLIKMRQKDPVTYPDLSLAVVKLLGSGEYVVEQPGESPVGHFGLALRDYTHSTAPNRRYPDIITQRQIKSQLEKSSPSYRPNELDKLAVHCTQQEDAADKVSRHMNKSAAALVLMNRIGEQFEGVVTGASNKGTWARVFNPPVEGKIIKGFEKLDVGDRVTVKLLDVDVPHGFIDFAAITSPASLPRL